MFWFVVFRFYGCFLAIMDGCPSVQHAYSDVMEYVTQKQEEDECI